MTPMYLKFPSETAAKTILSSNYKHLDTIGLIFVPTGNTTMTPDGMEMPIMEAVDGWHVNVLLCPGEDEEALAPYSVTPTNPRRIWA